MEIVVICAILGLIPAMIAKGKGRDPVAWWFYGALLFIVALIHVLFVSDLKQEQAQKAAAAKRRQEQQARTAEQAKLRDCPYCAEPIKRAAVKCKHCGSEVEALTDEPDVQPMTSENLEAEAARQREFSEKLHSTKMTDIPMQQPKVGMSTKHTVILMTMAGVLVGLMIYGAMGRG